MLIEVQRPGVIIEERMAENTMDFNPTKRAVRKILRRNAKQSILLKRSQ